MAFDIQAAKQAGYSDAEINAHMQSRGIQAPADDWNPTLNIAGFDTGVSIPKPLATGLAGAGKAFVDAGRGLGLVDAADAGQKAIEADLMKNTSAKIGNFAGNAAILAPTMLVPGANTIAGAAAVNGIANAALTEGNLKQRGAALLEGAAGGAGGQLAMRGLARIVRPNTAPQVQRLLDEGISLTPGQIMGGAARRIEDGLTSVPIVGDAIKAAQRRGIEDFNQVAISRAVDPIGGQVQGVGRDAIASAKQQLGTAYDNLLPKMQANALEPEFVQKLASLRGMAQGLPAKEAQQFDAILSRELDQRLAPNGVLSGDNLKAAQAGLRDQASGFSTATDGYQRQLGGALKQADQELRDLIMRSNPTNAGELKAINEGYANFKRVQRAAAGVGAQEGVFTPSQLQSAVKAMDRSKDKARFAQGDALMQDLAESGKMRMSQTVPDSGTPFRLGTMAALATGAINPMIPLSALAGAGVYTKAGQKAMEALLAKRPEMANQLAALLRNQGAMTAQTTGGALALEY